MTDARLSRRSLLKSAAALAAAGMAPAPLRAQTSADVLIIGAGISGLNAGLLLEEFGASVTVIEARNRIGGRVLSLRDIPGHPEAGANAILGGYGRMQDICKRLKIELRDYRPRSGPGAEIALQGKVIPKSEWPDSPLNLMPAGDKQRIPPGYMFKIVSEHNPLATSDDWVDPASAQYDEPVYDFLKRLKFSDAAIDLIFNTNLGYGTSAHDSSMLMWYFVQAWFRAQGDLAPVDLAAIGGNQLIPEAMAAALKGDVILNKTVMGIRSTRSGAEVHCQDGSVFKARRVICSMPLPPMRWMRFDPALPPLKMQAIRSVPSVMITQVHMVPRAPFWEEDGLAPSMWTDGFAGQIIAGRFGTSPDEVTDITAWARGFRAQYLDALGEKAAGEQVLAEIEALRPAARGKLAVAGLKSWQLDPFAGGDWVVWRPGQVSAFLPALGEPAGRLHFCGEHTALSNRGLEGAMESGERAALEALEKL